MPERSGPRHSQAGRSLIGLAVFAAGYLIAVIVSEQLYGSLAFPSPFWFPDAVLLCALLLTERSAWVRLLGTAFVIRLIAGAVPGTPTWFVFLATSVDLAKGVIAAWWLQRVAGATIRLNGLREFALFIGIAAMAVPLLGALLMTPARVLLGDAYWGAFTGWFMGDAVAQVIVTPTLLYWCTGGFRGLRARWAELVLLLVGLTGVIFLVFINRRGIASPLLVYAPVPFLLWAAVRFRPFGTANAIGLLAAGAMMSAVNDPSGFLGAPPELAVLALQLFLLVVALPVLALAVVIVQRQTESAELQTILDAAPIAILTAKDPACSQIVGNRTAYEVHLARTRENLSMDGPASVAHTFRLTRDGKPIPVEDLPLRRAIAGMSLVTGQPLTLERPDGTIRHLLGNAAPLLDADGKLIGAVGAFQDITEIRAAETALRESEARFRLVADAAPVMVWMSGTDQLCTYVNQPWLAFRNRTLDQEAGNGWTSGVHPDDLAGCLDTYAGSFEARREFRMEYRVRRGDGEYRWLLDHGAPRFDSAGVFHGYVGSCVDITDRKQAETSLRELSGRLIDEQERARARFARDLHDDLGQRMTLIHIGVERFARTTEGLSLEAHRQLRAILKSAEAMASDIQSMSHRLHPSTLDAMGLGVALRSVCREFGEQSHLEVRLSDHDVPRDLGADVCLSLFRVAQEALTNVVKHSGVAEASVELSGHEGTVTLCVRDAGVGFDMSSQALARAGFELYQHARTPAPDRRRP